MRYRIYQLAARIRVALTSPERHLLGVIQPEREQWTLGQQWGARAA